MYYFFSSKNCGLIISALIILVFITFEYSTDAKFIILLYLDFSRSKFRLFETISLQYWYKLWPLSFLSYFPFPAYMVELNRGAK